MQAIVNITLKLGVLDPQGRAILHSLSDLGFSEVSDVRVGKQILLDINETDPARLRQRRKDGLRTQLWLFSAIHARVV